MKSIAFLVTVLFLAAAVVHANGARKLLQCRRGVATASSSSRSGGSVFVLSRGNAQSSSESNEASAEVVAEAVTVLQNVNRNLPPVDNQDEQDYCPSAYAEVDLGATAIATAQARVYARSRTYIQVAGNGEGRGAASACAEAEATAFANALILAIAEARIGVDQALAEAEINARISAFARAFADASTQARVTGTGEAEAFQTSFARSSVRVVASVIVELIAGVDCEDIFQDIYAEAEGQIEDENVVAGGMGGSSANGTDSEGIARGESDAVTEINDEE
eukprot:g5689.t1